METLREKIAFLKTCDTSFVGDAYIRMGLNHRIEQLCIEGAVCSPLNREDRFAGIAVPVQFSLPREGQETWDMFDLISQSHPDTVYIMSGCEKRCYTGDVFVKYAALEGISAFVIEGYIRDVRDIAGAGMPVFCGGGTTAAKGGAAAKITAWNVPIFFHGRPVRPGDILMGDADGVVIIPPDLLDRVIYELEEIKSLEQDYLDVFAKGEDVLEGLRAVGQKKGRPRPEKG